MTAQEKACNLRYKKGIAAGFNLDSIRDELSEISDACNEIRWMVEGDEDTLIAALDGDEDEAYEFKMAFSELDGECDRLYENLSEDTFDGYLKDCFDDFFCRVAGGCEVVWGFDTYETDYYTLTSFESKLAQAESEKRLFRMTKKEILEAAEQCFGVASAFLNLRYKYDYLKSAFDIIRGENTSFLELVKDIENAYEKAVDPDAPAEDVRNFEKLVGALPDRTWIE